MIFYLIIPRNMIFYMVMGIYTMFLDNFRRKVTFFLTNFNFAQKIPSSSGEGICKVVFLWCFSSK